ncbi:hypothetical protein HZA87_00565 [Candidatus Uhrbacteria bacterium]|nr:hypothetical protein [Candidatus Uhrbacteria bacterium]
MAATNIGMNTNSTGPDEDPQVLRREIENLVKDMEKPGESPVVIAQILAKILNLRGKLERSFSDTLPVSNAAGRANTKAHAFVADENKRNRDLQTLENVFWDFARDEIENENNAEMENELAAFNTVRLETRYEENKAFREFGKSMIEFQKAIVEMLEGSKNFSSKAAQEKQKQIVTKMSDALVSIGCPVDEKDLHGALIDGDAQALDRLKLAMKKLPDDDENRAIKMFTQAANLYKAVKALRDHKFAGLAELCARASTASDITLNNPKSGWMKELKEDPGCRNAFIDLNLDEGSDYYLYIDGKGEVTVILANVDKRYIAKNQKVHLSHLNDEKLLTTPTASVVFAHAYEENEIVAAFNALPDRGVVMMPVLLESQNAFSDPLFFRKVSGQLEYQGKPPAGAPDIKDIRTNPCRWTNPMQLTFNVTESSRKDATL